MTTLLARPAARRLPASLRAALAPARATMLPLLMLPVLAGALWLLVWPAAARDGRLLAGLGAAALAWYLLGGALALGALREGRAARRALAGRLASLAALPGQVWATDGHGLVLWQNPAAAAAQGDRMGQPVASALTRIAAEPASLIETLAARAASRGSAETAAGDGRLRVEIARSGALQVWQYTPEAEPGREAGPASAGAPPPAPSAPPDSPPAGSCDAALFELLPVALLRIAPDGTIVAANGAARSLLGEVPEGGSLSQLLDGLGRPVDDWVDDALRGRTEPRPEILRRRRGPEAHLQVSLARDAEGGLLAMLSDASAMKTLEAQFVQSQKMQAIGQLAGGIAHDFNNLLTAISGHCDLLMLRHEKTDPDYADLDQIGQNANRAAALVGQLLAFSRKQTLKPRLMDLRDTLADLTHLLNRLVGERVRLEVENAAELSPIRADPRQFEQVIVNLVVNARDAMAHGGCVRVRARTDNLGRDAARRPPRLPPGEWVVVEVEDEGCGIPEDKLDKIFEPFFTTKRTGEGTGLGLSTVYGIVKQTGGYVFCDSTPGRGTVFSLYFPAHDRAELEAALAAEAADAAATARAVAAAPPGGRVLLVEDEAAVRAFAARALRMRGLEVVEAASAEAALAFLADSRETVDVFVTDVIMPGMDGPSWVRTALRERPATRVVFISGYTEAIFEDGRSPVPGALFLQKPFSLAALVDTITGLLATPPAGTRDGGRADEPRLSSEAGG